MSDTVEAILAAPVINGWHVLRDGRRVSLGDDVTLGSWVTLGNHVTLGDGVQLGRWVRVGNHVTLGSWVTLGNHVTLGDGVILGNRVRLGDDVTLGDGVILGNRVRLGDGVTSTALNEAARAALIALAPTHKFTKWVRPDRTSPNFDGGTPVHYSVGARVSIEGAEVSDQLCAPGFHVLRYGHRPEWYGLCQPGHDLIPLTVEVRSEDILFAGLPTMDGELRVRALVVLD
jgi:NDP-sugar pyrophosphorylase family protein